MGGTSKYMERIRQSSSEIQTKLAGLDLAVFTEQQRAPVFVGNFLLSRVSVALGGPTCWPAHPQLFGPILSMPVMTRLVDWSAPWRLIHSQLGNLRTRLSAHPVSYKQVI